jgi:hypothetical protein
METSNTTSRKANHSVIARANASIQTENQIPGEEACWHATLRKGTANEKRSCAHWPVGWNFPSRRLEVSLRCFVPRMSWRRCAKSASRSMRPSNFCKLGNCAVAVRTSNDWRTLVSTARALLGGGSAHGARRPVNKITAHIALPGTPGARGSLIPLSF